MDTQLDRAKKGDIQAYHNLFKEFDDALKSYVYRMVTDRSDMEDIVQDTFVKSFDKISSFQQKSSLKTWVFTIATNLCYDFLRNRKRWQRSILDNSKDHCGKHLSVQNYLLSANKKEHGEFDITEHIDFCFTCISKTIPIEQQIALLLKDVYGFKVKEIALIMDKGEGAVKHYVRIARETMMAIYDNRCALVNKNGACHQCSELNGWFNPKQNQQEALNKLTLYKASKAESKEDLFKIRTHIVTQMHPTRAKGTTLHEAMMQLHRFCANEITEPK